MSARQEVEDKPGAQGGAGGDAVAGDADQAVGGEHEHEGRAKVPK